MGSDPGAQHEQAMRMVRDENYVPTRWTPSVWVRLGLALTPALVVAVLLFVLGR